ncbi:MAG: GNAT family N-acetyltransferase [Desulfarculaceae bacterium]|jgi:L-amino acid N-acyltransferase YncA
MPISKHGYPRPVILKDGTEIRLRLLDPEKDGDELVAFYSRIPATDRWYLWHDVSDEQVVREVILNYDPRLVLPIIAETEEGRIVGKTTLYRYFPGARAHIARLRVVLDPWVRHKRLGTYMLLDIIQLAVNMGLSLLVAEFIQGVEDAGIRAARKLDFFEYASLPDYAKDPRGNFYNLTIMMKRIHTGYEDY